MKKVVLVEDDQFLNKVYGVKFYGQGFEVAYLTNGKDIVETVKREKADLVVMDLMMPGVDGFQALRELKGDMQTKNIPVLVLSNLSGDEDIKTVMSLGAAKFLVKSQVDINEVVEEVKTLLG